MKQISLALAALVLLAGCGWPGGQSNALFVISPYRHAGTWVFDDPGRGLKQEPFVAGIPGMIDKLVADIPDADQGFRLLFSTQAFPGHTHRLDWIREDSTGNWYHSPEFDEEGWLCPALLKFFRKAPKSIYVKAEPL